MDDVMEIKDKLDKVRVKWSKACNAVLDDYSKVNILRPRIQSLFDVMSDLHDRLEALGKKRKARKDEKKQVVITEAIGEAQD